MWISHAEIISSITWASAQYSLSNTFVNQSGAEDTIIVPANPLTYRRPKNLASTRRVFKQKNMRNRNNHSRNRRSMSSQRREQLKRERQWKTALFAFLGLVLITLVVIGIMALSRSGKSDQPEKSTQTPYIIVVTSTPDPGLIPESNSPSLEETVSPSQSDEIGVVVEVVDGDTIKVEIDGEVFKVRYIGIDTPELSSQEFMGVEASEANRALVFGKEVILKKDTSETDQYGRLLRYVYLLDGTFVNAALVEGGFAESLVYHPDTKFNDYFDELQAQAQANLLGIWQAYQSLANGNISPVQITLVDKKNEFVEISNLGDQTVNLSGWILRSDRGNQDCLLKSEVLILPGASLVIWARAADIGQGGYNCGKDENIWSNSESDPAILINEYNQIVDRYPPIYP